MDDAIERRDGMRYGDMCLRVERGGGRKGGRGGGDNSNFGPPRRYIVVDWTGWLAMRLFALLSGILVDSRVTLKNVFHCVRLD